MGNRYQKTGKSWLSVVEYLKVDNSGEGGPEFEKEPIETLEITKFILAVEELSEGQHISPHP